VFCGGGGRGCPRASERSRGGRFTEVFENRADRERISDEGDETHLTVAARAEERLDGDPSEYRTGLVFRGLKDLRVRW